VVFYSYDFIGNAVLTILFASCQETTDQIRDQGEGERQPVFQLPSLDKQEV
jgi:hypothetical protein